MAKPVLYHCPQTRGETTFWMNEEVGAVCDISIVNVRAGEQKSTDYLRINPQGKIPALKAGNAVVTEAPAICAYLADAFPEANLAPSTDDPNRGAYFRWMFFAGACVEPAMLDKFSGTKRENPASVGHSNFDEAIDIIAEALKEGPWLLGEQFTAADVALGSTLNFATMFGALEAKAPFVDYIGRLTSRPAYKSAQQKNASFMKDMG